jgi:outer membrane protein assembly factor BamD
MKTLRIILFTLLFAVAGGGYFGPSDAEAAANVVVNTEAATVALAEPKTAATEKGKKPRLTKEERLREKERVMAERATAAVEEDTKKGRRPGYNNLLKSTNYPLMYTEGLRYFHAKKKNKDYNSQQNYTRAQNLLDAVLQSQTYAGTPREDSLVYYLGCSFYKAGDFDVSEALFDNFRRRFTRSVFLEDVEYMYAMGFYFSSPDPSYDQTTTIRAMSAITEYQGRYPNTMKKEECTTRMEELRKKLYTKSFENANLYVTIGQYKAAVRALGNAIDEFPESPFREELMYLLTTSSYHLAKNSVPARMTDRYMAMMDNYYNLISDYPETGHRREVERMYEEAKKHIEKHTQESETASENGK